MDPITYWTVRLGWILVAWLFALGAVVGSFLNVVVYRLPAGKSIVHPGSSCPACGHLIRWYDNVPIVSWFMLGGRCRDCRAKISPRYPLVEFAAGMLFAGFFLVAARPRIVALADGNTATEPSGWVVLVRYGADLWLLSTLLSAALIEFDRMRVPRRLFLLAAAIGLIAAAAFPESRQDAPSMSIAILTGSPKGHAIAEAVTGLVAGWALGYLFEFLRIEQIGAARESKQSRAAGSAPFALMCMGALLGWFAVVAIGAVAAVMVLIARRFPEETAMQSRFGWSAAALISAVVWIVSP
jgi:leader peptidase (prepilin peptidase)/N-methyltransferase